MRKILFSFLVLFIFIFYYNYSKEDNLINSENCFIDSSSNLSGPLLASKLFNSPRISQVKKSEEIIYIKPIQLNNGIDDTVNLKITDIPEYKKEIVVIDSSQLIDDFLDAESPSPCHSLSVQLDTQLERIKDLEKIANKSRKEEGYREARNIKITQPPVFFDPLQQEKGMVVFRVNIGTVGFVHSHTLSDQTRGFYSSADVKIFLRLADITYENLMDEKIKTFSMYDLYSTLIYGNQIYTMRIDNMVLYKKFHNNEENIKIEMISKLDEMYKNVDVHFNFFKDNFKSFPDENQEALNSLSSKVLSKIGIRIYKLENYDKKNKLPRWRKLLPDRHGIGTFVNPC